MALLLIEGFEGAPSAAGGASVPMHELLWSKGFWCFGQIWSDAGRIAGVSFKDHSNRGLILGYKTSDDTIIFGMGFKASTWSGAGVGHPIARIMDWEGNVHASIETYNTDEWRVIVPEGSYVTTNNSGGINTWYYLEFKIVIHNTTGSFEFKVNEISELSDTAIDTQANSDGSSCMLNLRSAIAWRWMDDIYICDSTGSAQNDFLGVSQVIGKFPDGDGGTTDFTPQGAGANYVEVDEATIDDDTTYNYGVSGDIDYYDYDDLSNGYTIHGIQINTTVRTTDAESFAIRSKIDSNGSIATGTSRYINATYSTEYEISTINPDTSTAWTTTAVDAAEFGLEVV
jgi:hypothetical protein